jgi:hypothetical protein
MERKFVVNTRWNVLLPVLSLTLTTLVAGSVANAQTLNYDLKPNQTVFLTISTDGGATPTGVNAGTFLATLTGGSGAGFSDPFNFDAYCIDLTNTALLNTSFNVSINPIDNLSTGNLQGVAWLYMTYAAGITDATHAAALQVAMWDVLTDGRGSTISTGNFQLLDHDGANDVGGYADTYLASLGNNNGTATAFRALDHTNDNVYQDVIGPMGGPVVPEGNSLIMMGVSGIGMVPFLLRRRKLALQNSSQENSAE